MVGGRIAEAVSACMLLVSQSACIIREPLTSGQSSGEGIVTSYAGQSSTASSARAIPTPVRGLSRDESSDLQCLPIALPITMPKLNAKITATHKIAIMSFSM